MTTDITPASTHLVLSRTPPDVLAVIYALEEISLAHCEQTEIPTQHLLHAGMYTRTIEMPPGTVLTGAEMKLATVLVICGKVRMLAGADWVDLVGYNVIPASAWRKQVFESISRTWITMVFPTHAHSTEEAEAEFTDQAPELLSRRQANTSAVVVTGE